MLQDLARRSYVAIVLIAGLIAVLCVAYNPWFRLPVALLMAAVAAVAIWEYEQFAKAKGGQMIFPALVCISVFEVLAFFFAAHKPFLNPAPPIIFFVGFLILFALHFRQKDGAVVDLAVSSFGLLYIAVPIGMSLGILYFASDRGEVEGRWWMIYLLVVTKITDVGAYFAGSLWGRRKLAPKISPGKTVEGAVFGLLCAVAVSYLAYFLSQRAGPGYLSLRSTEWWILGIILGVTGQFGDLSESLLKRDANKKDSNALPGLGGVLDSVDSLLFNAPILYFYLHYIKP
jgi:phosphatidate cytidylyltransferase